MSGYSEEEFQSFIKQNRDLIERMMSLQKQAAVETLSAGREIAHEAVGSAVDTADKAKEKNLLLVPGDDFGCPEFFRICTCVSYDMIQRSLPVFKELIED